MNQALTMPTAEPFFFPGGPTGCLLVHGFTGTPKEMRWLGEHLASQGYSVLGVRLAAHATRPEDMIRARWRDWLVSVEDGWNLLSGCCETIFVMGLSMGGMLSLTFAARFPVAGVVAMATPHHIPPDPRVPFVKPLSIFKPFIPKEPSNWYDPQAYEQHADYPVEPTRAYIEIIELMDVLHAALPQVSAPALLINSKNDQTVTVQEKHMEGIYDALGSQDKGSLWVENSHHVITEDAARQEVFQAVSDFVARVAAGNA
jgi:carboxylesterase